MGEEHDGRRKAHRNRKDLVLPEASGDSGAPRAPKEHEDLGDNEDFEDPKAPMGEDDTVQAATRQDDVTDADPGAFQDLERLFRDNHRRVFKAAYRVTGNASDAEDVLQTVFLRLLKRGRSAPASETLPASYLHLAAINGALDVVRGRTASRSTPLDDLAVHPAAEPSSRPDAQSAGTEMHQRLRRGLARLNPRAAEVFVLRYLEGYSNLEIARMLGKPQTLIAVTLHRARKRLRDELGSEAGGLR